MVFANVQNKTHYLIPSRKSNLQNYLHISFQVFINLVSLTGLQMLLAHCNNIAITIYKYCLIAIRSHSTF